MVFGVFGVWREVFESFAALVDADRAAGRTATGFGAVLDIVRPRRPLDAPDSLPL